MRRSVALMAALLGVSPLAEASVVRSVDAGGPYVTIQDAVDASSNGDVILVAAGTWSECVDLSGVSVTLVGLEGLDKTEIACDGSASYAISVDQDSWIAGFTLTNDGGGGVHLSGASLWGTDLLVSGVTAEDGAGFYSRSGALMLTRVTVEDAASTRNGGGIYSSNGDVELVQVTLSNTSAEIGGGVFLLNTVFLAHHLDVEYATADSRGGGIRAAMSSLTVTDSSFRSAVARSGAVGGKGGGVFSDTGGDAVFTRVAFTECEADVGGAIYSDVSLTVLSSTLKQNSAESDGGAIYQTSSGTLDVSASTLEKNDAGNDGGAVLNGSTMVSSANEYRENTASGNGGGLSNEGYALLAGDTFESNEAEGFGGALYENGLGVSTYGVLMKDNTADSGGGVFVNTGSRGASTHEALQLKENSATAIDGYGGGMTVYSEEEQQCQGCLFEANTAVSVGGGLVLSGLSDFDLHESEMASNTAAHGGGIGYLGSASGTTGGLYIRDTRIVSNEATSGVGGGVYAVYPRLFIERSWIDENTAVLDGGGMYLSQNISSTIESSRICANSANRGGGVFLKESRGYRGFKGTVLQDNVAASYGGGLYEFEYSSAGSAYFIYTRYEYMDVVGNQSTGTVHDGMTNYVSSYSSRQDIYYSIFYDNDETGLSLTSSSTSALQTYYGVLFDSHSSSSVYQTEDDIDSYENYETDPLYASYSDDGDCSNDDLTQGTTLTGYNSKGYGSGDLFAFTCGSRTYSIYEDADGDGVSIAEGDCDDCNASMSPALPETAGDGYDNDCSGGEDRDMDGDGELPATYGGSDCNDADVSVWSGATEVYYDGTDGNCDGLSDYDADGDGEDSDTYGGLDCNDSQAGVHTGAVDVPYDGLDVDCSGSDYDADGDGEDSDVYGGADCNDFDSEVFTSATEIWYDGVDQNCDGKSDWDADGDGFDGGMGGEDCDDEDASISPDAEELWYDGVDQNCDGLDDYDQDGDGHYPLFLGGDDCDDTEATVYLGAEELPDGLDNNCDGESDPDSDEDGVLDYFEAVFDTDPWSSDSDGDGVTDGEEWNLEDQANPPDSDGDEVIDALDEDSDADSLLDGYERGGGEKPRDSDADWNPGTPDFQDMDDDGDTIPTWMEVGPTPGSPVDTDGDGVFDYLDRDSDNDGATDRAEGWQDSDDDGVPNYQDNDADGAQSTIPDGRPAGSYGFGCHAADSMLPALGGIWLLIVGLIRRRTTPNVPGM